MKKETSKMKISTRKHDLGYVQGISIDFEDFLKYKGYLDKLIKREVKSRYSEYGNSYYIYLSKKETNTLYPLIKDYIFGNRSYEVGSKIYFIIRNFKHGSDL